MIASSGTAGATPADRARHAVRPVVAVLLVGAVMAAAGRMLPPAVTVRDVAVVRHVVGITRAHPDLERFLLVWQAVFQPWLVYLVTLGVVWLLRRRLPLERMVWALVTVPTCWATQAAVKLVVHRPRPDAPVVDLGGYSFPSGHAAGVTTAAMVLLLVARPMSPGRRLVALFVAGIIVLVTCLDRVALGVHHPSDVLAGVAFGVIATLVSFRLRAAPLKK